MEIIILGLFFIFIGLLLTPVLKEEDIRNEFDEMVNYKLIHCNVHKWISKPTGFDGKEFESSYLVCSVCKFNPETKTYEN